MRVNADLIILRIFSMQRPEALMVCHICNNIPKACTVGYLCCGHRQIFIDLPSVFNERFMDLRSFDSQPINEETACCAMQSVPGWRISAWFWRPGALIPRMATALKIDIDDFLRYAKLLNRRHIFQLVRRALLGVTEVESWEYIIPNCALKAW